jgi:microcompartment protein PduB
MILELENLKEAIEEARCVPASCTEFIGTSIGNTIGLVIANVESRLHELMGLDKKFHAIGILSDRFGGGPQIMACDDAVKATNTEVLSVEMTRDPLTAGGHGALIILGAEDVSDAKKAIMTAINNLPKYYGDVYANETAYLELQYTARAGSCISKAFGSPEGKAFGLVNGSPAGIGIVVSDAAVKTANIEIHNYGSPQHGTCFSNEFHIMFHGDSGAVRQAVLAARDKALPLIHSLGGKPKPTTEPYI